MPRDLRQIPTCQEGTHNVVAREFAKRLRNCRTPYPAFVAPHSEHPACKRPGRSPFSESHNGFMPAPLVLIESKI